MSINRNICTIQLCIPSLGYMTDIKQMFTVNNYGFGRYIIHDTYLIITILPNDKLRRGYLSTRPSHNNNYPNINVGEEVMSAIRLMPSIDAIEYYLLSLSVNPL